MLGTSIRLDGELYTIIGVMPPGTSVEFGLNLADPQLWRPLPADAPPPRGAHDLRSVAAKLKAGVTLDQARAQMEAIGDRLAAEYPETNKGYGVVVQPFPRPVGLHFEASLYLLFAAAAVVLLLACVNLANLALARGVTRVRETAIRTALGARRTHLIRQILTEHLLVAGVGGLCGVMVGYGMLATLKTAVPTSGVRVAFPADTRISIDVWVWLFAFVLTALSGVVCGLLSAIGMTQRPLVADLREGGAGVGTGRTHRRLQRVLVVGEVALAFSLLTGAGLLIQSLFALTQRIETGFDATNVVTARLPVPETRFASGVAYNAYLDQLASRVQSLPAIRDVAFADALPTEGNPFGKLFQIVGQPIVPYVSRPLCGFKVVSPSYFSAVGLRLIEGRALEDRDRDDAPLVVVINQAMARTYFREVDPLGQRMLMRRNPVRGLPGTVDLDWTVVGSVADEGVSPFDDRTAQPAVYVTREQYPRLDLALVVRTTRDPAHLENSIRRTDLCSQSGPSRDGYQIRGATRSGRYGVRPPSLDSAVRICRHRGRARDTGALRCHGVRRRATGARDRDSRRVGREHRESAGTRDASRDGDDRMGPWRGTRDQLRGHSSSQNVLVWRWAVRSDDDDCRCRRTDRCRHGGMLCPRTPRDGGRSAHRTQV